MSLNVRENSGEQDKLGLLKHFGCAQLEDAVRKYVKTINLISIQIYLIKYNKHYFVFNRLPNIVLMATLGFGYNLEKWMVLCCNLWYNLA